MTSLAFSSLPAWGMCLSLAAHLVAGIAVGVIYFRSLWWNARRFTMGGHVATTIAMMIGRFVILGVVLTLASLEGALPLLLMALGVLIARFVVVRRIGEIIP
jgi:F1F0 ATPase subunit 2